MIVIRLCGGLGNQLFQYATGRRLAYLRRAELVLDLGWYARTPSSDTPWTYQLGHYPIQARSTTWGEAVWCVLHGGTRLRSMSFLPQRWIYYREQGFEFDPEVLNLNDDTYLDGYWQSYRYFEDSADLIRAELAPVAPLERNDEVIATMIAGGDAVSLHVRRGDYVTNQAAGGAHCLCSLDYYKSAVEQVLMHVARPHFFVFSDDSAWARANLFLPSPATFVDHNGPDSAFQDLRLMALCNHHITANSSFSWWGAWLNPSPNKIVVTPHKWFADQRNTEALTPTTWMRIT